jgi:hypothetical protein
VNSTAMVVAALVWENQQDFEDTAGLDSLHSHPYFHLLIPVQGMNLANCSIQVKELTLVLLSFSLIPLRRIE